MLSSVWPDTVTALTLTAAAKRQLFNSIFLSLSLTQAHTGPKDSNFIVISIYIYMSTAVTVKAKNKTKQTTLLSLLQTTSSCISIACILSLITHLLFPTTMHTVSLQCCWTLRWCINGCCTCCLSHWFAGGWGLWQQWWDDLQKNRTL